jgi:hypothetical protein
MASIRKIKSGYKAEVARGGIRMSKNFPTKRAASDWAARQEYLILNDDILKTTTAFGDVLQRYAREVSHHKRGVRQEIKRIDGICKDRLASIRLADLQATDFTDYRDRRIQVVAAGTVRREMSTMTAILNVAQREWGLFRQTRLMALRSRLSHRDGRVGRHRMKSIEWLMWLAMIWESRSHEFTRRFCSR